MRDRIINCATTKMTSISPRRPTRRAATRIKDLVDDSDQENGEIPIKAEDDEDDFMPASQRSPRRPSRRKTTDAPPTPRTAVRTRRVKTGEDVEASQLFDQGLDQSTPNQPASPTKRGSPRKRKSAAPPKKIRGSASVEDAPLLTPRPPKLLDTSDRPGKPLADITETKINEQIHAADSQKQFVATKALETVMEKPMDIVIRSRALAIPPVQENTGPKARMVIQNLVLTNFKSYAGRQEVGPFHASFSSVVGPNGSGKSNVIDSLLFVFGFRASKMRQGKISALIHNSATFPSLEHCEVEVHFQEVTDLVCDALSLFLGVLD